MNAKAIDWITNVIGFLIAILEPVKSYLTSQPFSWTTFALCIGTAVIAYFTGKGIPATIGDLKK